MHLGPNISQETGAKYLLFNKGRSITIQIHKDLDAHQVRSQVANQWNRLPAEVGAWMEVQL